MTKQEIFERIFQASPYDYPGLLRNALKTGKLTETEISKFFDVPFEILGISEIHRDNFRV